MTKKVIETNPFDHIIYEFSMYLQASVLQSTDQFVNNLLVESRMIHMRNLAYFFCSQKEKGKSYLHYTTYISEKIPDEIDHEVFIDIQRITSNSTCHLLKGRFSETFKQETALFEQSVFPIFVRLIKKFLDSANKNIRIEFLDQWKHKQIQENVSFIMDLIAQIVIDEKMPIGITGNTQT